MTDIKRRPRKVKPNSEYATRDDARRNRREFLRLLGRGLAAVPLVGLANACGSGREQYELQGVLRAPEDIKQDALGPDAVGEPDYELSGGAPFEPDIPVEEDFTTAGIVDSVEEPDFVSPGGPVQIDIEEEPDLQEQDYMLSGLIDDPDLHEQPTPDVQEEDYMLSGGIGEPPPED